MLIFNRLTSYILYLARIFVTFVLAGTISSCGEKAFLEDAVNASKVYIESGDMIIVSGGNVASTSSPYPLHQIQIYSDAGDYKATLYNETTGYLMGLSLNYLGTGLLFTVDNVDRIDEIIFSEQGTPANHILNSGLSGNTLRSVAALSDGGTIVAESTASIEKFDSDGNRVTTNFPISVSSSIMKLRAISGDRFAIANTGGNDRVSIRNNDGTVVTSVTSGIACGTNCDPSDILELPDGRFIISYLNSTAAGLYLYDSSFAYIGQLFQDKNILQGISALALLKNGDILACSTTFNDCERLALSGNTATRIGTQAFISGAEARQPTDVVVVP